MAKQNCTNCIAFDDYADFCRLGRRVTFEYKHFSEHGIDGKFKVFKPIEKCAKPKNKKQFFEMFKDCNNECK